MAESVRLRAPLAVSDPSAPFALIKRPWSAVARPEDEYERQWLPAGCGRENAVDAGGRKVGVGRIEVLQEDGLLIRDHFSRVGLGCRARCRLALAVLPQPVIEHQRRVAAREAS